MTLELLQRLVSAAFSKRCMSPQVAECSLNAARVVKLLKMFHVFWYIGVFFLPMFWDALAR